MKLKSILCATLLSTSTAAFADLTDHEKMAREMLAEAVALDTSVIKRQTPQFVTNLTNRFIAAGFDAEDIKPVPIKGFGGQALTVRYKGKDRTRKAIGFLGHMDAVTANPADWELDPFTMTEEGDFFIGRGVADNKSGVIGLSATFIKLKSEGYIPDRDLILIFSGDEETTMWSTTFMAREMKEELNLEYAINSDAGGGTLDAGGKPSMFGVQTAEKTYHTVQLTVRNPGGHSSRPRKDNAIYQLMRALQKIEAYKFPVRLNETSKIMLANIAKQESGSMKKALIDLAADPTNEAAATIVSENVSYNSTIRTTCVTTMLDAGHAENALPQRAVATVNCRITPETDYDEVEAVLAKVIGDEGVEISHQRLSRNAAASPLRKDVMDAVRYAIDGGPAKGVPIGVYMSSGGTDGKEFRAEGIPVYAAGGLFGRGGESNAHGLNEKIRSKWFFYSLGHWERLIRYVSGGVQ